MSGDLVNRICTVTGAAGGIGLGIAEAFADEGANVAMIDVRTNELEREANNIRERGGNALAYPLDVTNREAVFDVFARITDDVGPTDILVNSAGVVDQCPFEDITEDSMNRMMRVNVNGTLFCCQAAAPHMKETRRGTMINFSSKSGKTGSALMAHYSAAKGAIISLTHALAFELAPHNVTVNCVCPGITEATGVWGEVSRAYSQNMAMNLETVRETFMAKVPLKRLTQIKDVVNFVLFLATRADYCTGQAFNITGGREVH